MLSAGECAMNFRCSDVVRLFTGSTTEVRVLGGHGGMHHIVRWTYVADAMDNLLSTLNWITGSELIVLSGSNIVGDPGRVLVEYIRRSHKKNIAGIVINIGKWIPEIPGDAIAEANRLNLPLMTVPWETRFVDFTKRICTAIVAQSVEDEANNVLAENLLFGESPDSSHSRLALAKNGFEYAAGFQVAVLNVAPRRPMPARKQIEMKNGVDSFFQLIMEKEGIKSITTRLGENIISIIPAPRPEDCRLDLMKRIAEQAGRLYPNCLLHIGMGRTVGSLQEIPRSFQDAQQVMRLCRHSGENDAADFDSIGVYSLLLASVDETSLRTAYYSLFSPLIEYDKNNGSALLFTLFSYLENDASLGRTAKELYVHENTLKYRLNKIKAILQMDLKRLEDLCRLKIGFMIGRILGEKIRKT